MPDSAHTEKKKGCLNTKPKKIACAFCCIAFIVLAVILPVYFFIWLPAELMQKFKDNLAFYPCSATVCAGGADPIARTCLSRCEALPVSNPATIVAMQDLATGCVTQVAGRAQLSERLGFELVIQAYNAINKIDIKHLSLVIKPAIGGMAASTSVSLAAETYVDAGSILACVMTGPATLAAEGWSPLTLHCEADASTNLAPLLQSFMAGLPLPSSTTYAATADTPLGEKSLEGTYESSSSTRNLMAESGCPALTMDSQALILGDSSGTQCAMPGSPTFLATLPSCALDGAVQTEALSAFLCCLVKSTDGIGILTPLLCIATGGMMPGVDCAAALGGAPDPGSGR